MTLDEAIRILRSPEGKDETKRVYRLDRTVDLAVQLIYAESSRLTRAEAEKIVDELSRLAEELFPGSRDTFAIVYGRRMQRIIGEVFGTGN